MSASEAEERWGLKSGTVRASCTRGNLSAFINIGLVRKSGNTWLIHETSMKKVYGEENKKLTKKEGRT